MRLRSWTAGKCILQLRGVRPFLSDKYDITRHPNFQYTADADDKNAFDIAPRRAHIPPLVVYLCAPRKRGEYVTSAFQCPRLCHSVPPSLSFSALVRVDCGGVVSRLSDLILDIICWHSFVCKATDKIRFNSPSS